VIPLGWKGNLLIDGTYSGAWRVGADENGAGLDVTIRRAASTPQLRDVVEEGERLLAFADPGSDKREVRLQTG
jgi:hypothetical protein